MFRYKALTTRKNRVKKGWFYFEFRDCPAMLWENLFFLAGRVNTPIMYFSSIVRGHPTLNIFEGDRVFDKVTKEEIGVIVYDNGFKVQQGGTTCKKELSLEHIYVVEGDRYSVRSINQLERTPIEFKSSGIVFDFTNLVSIQKGVMCLISSKKTIQVDSERVSELIYYEAKSGFKVFDGELIKGDFVTMDTISEFNKTKEKRK